MDKVVYKPDIVDAEPRDQKLGEVLQWLRAVQYQVEFFERSSAERRSLIVAIDALTTVRPKLVKFDGLTEIQQFKLREQEKIRS